MVQQYFRYTFGRQENETVIIIGMGDKLELWSHGAWEAYKGTFGGPQARP